MLTRGAICFLQGATGKVRSYQDQLVISVAAISYDPERRSIVGRDWR